MRQTVTPDRLQTRREVPSSGASCCSALTSKTPGQQAKGPVPRGVASAVGLQHAPDRDHADPLILAQRKQPPRAGHEVVRAASNSAGDDLYVSQIRQ